MIATVKRVFGFYSLPLYIMGRPFAGFYAMKYEHQGTMKIAFLNFALVCISYAISDQYASILANDAHPLQRNSLFGMMMILGALLLFSIANWSVTALTDGEGKLKDIIMAICYAMTPLVLTIAPAAVISNFLSTDEMGLYHLLMAAGMIYFVVLVFAGLITVHNYGAIKALLTILLTFVAILVIAFLISLLLTLWTQLFSFAYSVYTELMFRS
ncbi:MAG: YIP1 family protein [Defluviitaleaceae bacterium]|nr:YIP1 family protein [Defluviitaleaceae bacterium]MCL2273763.1 YIP1 family protein [Defluviitaleaceae bacterium]